MKNYPFYKPIQLDWKEINFLSQKIDWIKFESNNKLIALNVLFPPDIGKKNKRSIHCK